MSLNGSIRVNDTMIGVWYARRTTKLARPDTTYTYDAGLSWHDIDGTPHSKKFTVLHRYDDGPVALASKVLAVATGLILADWTDDEEPLPVAPPDHTHADLNRIEVT